MFAVHNNNNWVTDVLQSGGRDNWEGKEESERGGGKKKRMEINLNQVQIEAVK